jgi:hypothetical protein
VLFLSLSLSLSLSLPPHRNRDFVWRTMKRKFENVHEDDSDDETLFAMKERHDFSDNETLHDKKEKWRVWRYDYHTF